MSGVENLYVGNTYNDVLMNAKETSDSDRRANSNMENAPSAGHHIDDPFEDVLVWPKVNENITGKKRRKQEHVPSVATSGRWLQWHNKKESEKRDEEIAKKARIEKRKLIKQQKEEQKEEQKREKIEKKRQRDEMKESKKADKENAKQGSTEKQLKRGRNQCKQGSTDKKKNDKRQKTKIR